MSRREVLEAAAGRSLWQDAGHRLLRNRAAMLADFDLIRVRTTSAHPHPAKQ